jgi:hypothetical protein
MQFRTLIQIFVLSYLCSEDSKKYGLLDSIYTNSNTVRPTRAITIRHMSFILLDSLSSETLSPENVEAQLIDLFVRGLL